MSFGIPVRNGLSISLLSTTSLSSGRGLRPSLALNFLSGTLDNRITFTRSSSATLVNASGVIESVTANTPRFDYDPVTLAPRGLLIEEQRTNLLTYSEQFDNAAWAKSNATISANATTSPDGTVDADKLVENTAASVFHYANQTVTKAASAIQYTATCYVKDAGRQVQIYLQSGSNGVAGRVNPADGTVTSAAAAFGAGWTAGTLTTTSVGNGWWRVTLVATSDTTTSIVLQFALHNGSTVVYTGDGISGVHLYGAQLEAGAFATSYIPTVASQVTRTADVATMTGTNFSSWYNQSEGTLVVSALDQNTAASGTGGYFAVGDSTLVFGSAETIYATRSRVVGAASFGTIIDNGVIQGNLGNIVIPTGVNTIAVAYKLNDTNMAANGAVGTTDTTCTMPTPTSLSIGTLASGWNGAVNPINGHIRSIAYYPTRLSNAQLQALTA